MVVGESISPSFSLELRSRSEVLLLVFGAAVNFVLHASIKPSGTIRALPDSVQKVASREAHEAIRREPLLVIQCFNDGLVSDY